MRYEVKFDQEGVGDIEVVEVHVGVGDAVEAGDPLVTVATDKADVDIGAPATGRVEAVLVAPLQVVTTEVVLVVLETEGGA